MPNQTLLEAKLLALESTDIVTGQNYCDPWWDGIYRWPLTLANTTIAIPCKDIFALTDLGSGDAKLGGEDYSAFRHYARRKCGPSGEWAWNNWTNYTECLNLLALQEKDTSMTNRIQSIVSYIVLIFLITSLVSLIISIVIFISFKPLKCLRICVHKNLCLALLMNCALYIIMNSLVGIHKLDLSVVADWFCKSLKALNVYSSMATINWMFVEGFHFHKALSSPFQSNSRLYLYGYYFIGWIVPGICVLAWTLALEYLSVVATKPCWEGYRSSNTIFIISLPMIIAVGINFLFLINIIRILLTKLRADSQSDHATIKAIKATALLIPLLGIHHIVVLYNPSTFNRKLLNIYIVINVLFQSVQGIIVSVLYCFTNNEVRTVLNSAWSRRRLSHSFLGGGGLGGGGGEGGGGGSSGRKKRRQSATSNSFFMKNQNEDSIDNISNNNHLEAEAEVSSTHSNPSPILNNKIIVSNSQNGNHHSKLELKQSDL